MGPIGIPELIIVLVILLVIFGPKRLPDLGKSIGSGMREFKDSITGDRKDDDDERPRLEAGPSEAERSVTATAAERKDDKVTEPRA